MNKTVLITGATGFIGRYLIKELISRGDKIIAVTTNPEAAKKKLNGVEKIISMSDFSLLADEQIDAIINLAGVNLASKRWNTKFKQDIYDSRIETTNKLVKFISVMPRKPEVLLSASGVDYYGDTGDKDIYEDSPPAKSFMGKLCRHWEGSAKNAENYGVRVVMLRTGFVMAKDASAVKKLTLPYKFFVGGPVGSGKQYMSWIHIDDLVGIYLFALDNKNVNGVYNAAAPNPEPMKIYCKHMASVMHRPSLFPVPAFAVKIVLGEMSQAVLYGRKALPKKLVELGYKFKFANAIDAWKDVL